MSLQILGDVLAPSMRISAWRTTPSSPVHLRSSRSTKTSLSQAIAAATSS
jgi:hypothetical protein